MQYFLTVKEFCSVYRVGRTRAYELIASGEVEAVKSGSRTLIVAESATRWAASLPRVGDSR